MSLLKINKVVEVPEVVEIPEVAELAHLRALAAELSRLGITRLGQLENKIAAVAKIVG